MLHNNILLLIYKYINNNRKITVNYNHFYISTWQPKGMQTIKVVHDVQFKVGVKQFLMSEK